MVENKDKKFFELPDIEKDFSEWYNSVVFKSDLAEQAPTRGCIVIKPYGYALWEEIKGQLDLKIKSMGVKNAAFPLLIPLSYIEREADHVDGFAPEMAVVTHAGGKELEEKLVVRPTSETVIHSMFRKWIKSWRDLPVKVNQWCNIIRWEKRPRAFLRTTEFFWQEGHTAHESSEEAYKQAYEAREKYVELIKDYLAIPLMLGKKPEYEKFPGARETLTMEAIMPNGKALQMGTSHILGDGFSKQFNILFQNKDGKEEHPVLTSWGVTTRLIGAVIMVHGDRKGLILPPKIATTQVVIVPFLKKGKEDFVLDASNRVFEKLKEIGVRVELDDNSFERPGFKFNKWELKGVPFRIEIGEKELAENSVVLFNRATGEKKKVSLDVFLEKNSLSSFYKKEESDFHNYIYDKAKVSLRKNTHSGFFSESEWGSAISSKNGFYEVFWCGRPGTEEVFKKHSVSVRCVLGEDTEGYKEACASCSASACCKRIYKVLIAKSY